MRYGGIRQEPLDIILEKVEEISREHGGYGDGGKDQEEGASGVDVRPSEVPEEEGEHRPFG